jgi:hypothetical protein
VCVCVYMCLYMCIPMSVCVIISPSRALVHWYTSRPRRHRAEVGVARMPIHTPTLSTPHPSPAPLPDLVLRGPTVPLRCSWNETQEWETGSNSKQQQATAPQGRCTAPGPWGSLRIPRPASPLCPPSGSCPCPGRAGCGHQGAGCCCTIARDTRRGPRTPPLPAGHGTWHPLRTRAPAERDGANTRRRWVVGGKGRAPAHKPQACTVGATGSCLHYARKASWAGEAAISCYGRYC